ncbi:MAG: YdcF family protein [Actinobacteria bacterium]|nr:YdcF family protein [Actinomycetota bacterium]
MVPLLVVGGCWSWIRWSTRGAVDSVASAPEAPVAIVLGAGLRDGEPSPYLAARLEVGADLLRQGKVRALLVSGDNGEVSYDEVTAMERWLLDHGVPASKIVKDHAGFDTWSSCTRAHRIFGVDEALVVTQDFHVRRAVYLCREAGIETHGVVAPTEGGRPALNALREGGASVKAVVDGILEPDPRYLGPREPGVDDALADDTGT